MRFLRRGHRCAACGARHTGAPPAYDTGAPVDWHADLASSEWSFLDEEQCVIDMQRFFIRAGLDIAVLDHDDDFTWGVWVELDESDFARAEEVWDVPGRESEPPVPGVLASDLPAYPVSTVGLEVELRTREVGLRPTAWTRPVGHPLAHEQRDGMTIARVQEIADVVRRGTGWR